MELSAAQNAEGNVDMQNGFREDNEDTSVIASSYVATGTYSLPQVAEVRFWRLFGTTKIGNTKRYQVKAVNGILCLKSNVCNFSSWINLICPAADCQEQNCEAFWPTPEDDDQNATSRLQLRVVKPIQEGQELKVWFSGDFPGRFTMPFLEPRHIQGPSKYVCHKCLRTFQQPNPLKVHLYYGGCTPYDTNNLNLSLVPVQNIYEASDRLGNEIPTTESEKEIKGHVCNYCGKAYSRRYGLKIHVRTHTGYKPLKCPYCFRPFSDPSNLNKHVRLHARANNPYNCVLCGKVLVRRRDLDRHLKARHPSQINIANVS